MFRDCGYRTALGTCFYDRVRELEGLEKTAFKTLIVYGPRGCGKSELIRYYSRRLVDKGYLVVYYDARGFLGERFIRSMGVTVWHGVRDISLRALRGLLSIIEALKPIDVNLRGLIMGVREILSSVSDLARAYSVRGVYVVIDEIQMLEGYRGDLGWRTLSTDLEAITGLLAKHDEFKYLNLVMVSSEGYMSLSDVRRRTLGYSTWYMLVEGMDIQSFKELYEEYCLLSGGCSVKLDTILKLTGPLPGFISEFEIASKGGHLSEYIVGYLRLLSSTISRVAEVRGVDELKLYEGLLEVFEYRGSYIDLGVRMDIVEELVKANIVYEDWIEGIGPIVKPQLNLYKLALEEALSRGVPLRRLDLGELSRRLLEV